ncbi:uncharacterized protein Hr96 isoform X2 [Macrobrachium rosenbergii]|uniref:uncharacterized protein Hr96 isoform X2 n=1 Tax=Macrobrachium rosenbergii TaxID=79674 RepID=UPI0034D5B84B
MSLESEGRSEDALKRCRLIPPEEEIRVSPVVLSSVPPQSPCQEPPPPPPPPSSSMTLDSPWYSAEGAVVDQHAVASSVLGNFSVVSSSVDHQTVTSYGHMGAASGGGAVEDLREEGDLHQPWYTCLYSPPSLQQSPLQELVDATSSGNSSAAVVEGHSYPMPHHAGYSLVGPASSSASGVYPGPLAMKLEEPRQSEEVMAGLNMENPSGFDCVGLRVEDYRLGGHAMPEEEDGSVNLMTAAAASTGAWMVDDMASGGTTWPSVKMEAWSNPHGCSRYVSEEGGAYWLPSGWQVASAGMMEESMESPEEPVTSPQDGASTSGGKRPDSKKCGVCGDRALGYNFNAITCESCKAFFRRNALKNKEFRCPFQDSCKVDQVTRRFCQKCRLRKCFEIGMKKEWIMTEEEKQRKKQKIEENRARKMGDAYSDDDSLKSSVPPFSPFSSGSTGEANKPQAIVVGVIRSEEESSAKVLRAEGQTDIHSQERTIIQSTGTLVDKPSLPSGSSVEYYKEEKDYGEDITSSPTASQQEIPPRCSEDQDFSGSISSHPSRVLQLLPYSHTTSPNDNSVESDSFIPSPHATVAVNASPGSAHCLAPESPATPTSQPLGNLSMAQVMAINIKKEVEYTDSETNQSPAESRENTELQQDIWQNFSVQEALRMLQPGCKTNSCVTGITMMDSIMNTAISAEYSAFSLLGSSNPRELNEPEKMKLSELSEANKGLMAPLCEDYNFKQPLVNQHHQHDGNSNTSPHQDVEENIRFQKSVPGGSDRAPQRRVHGDDDPAFGVRLRPRQGFLDDTTRPRSLQKHQTEGAQGSPRQRLRGTQTLHFGIPTRVEKRSQHNIPSLGNHPLHAGTAEHHSCGGYKT